MQIKDMENFKTMWKLLSQMYGKEPQPNEMLEIIFGTFITFTFEQVQEATRTYLKTGKFMPRPADIIEIMFGTSAARARVAFLSAVRARETVKAWQSIAFEDKTTHEVIYALGGWGEFCHALSQNRTALEARFIKWHEAAQSIEERKAPKILGSDKTYWEVMKNDDIRCMRELPKGDGGQENP